MFILPISLPTYISFLFSILAQRISSINSISAICELTGADVTEAATAAGADTRPGPKFLQASVGHGGSCFQKDTPMLAHPCEGGGSKVEADHRKPAIVMNDHQKRRFSRKIVKAPPNTTSDKASRPHIFHFLLFKIHMQQDNTNIVPFYLLENCHVWPCTQERHRRHQRTSNH